jgi:hypothetical protein
MFFHVGTVTERMSQKCKYLRAYPNLFCFDMNQNASCWWQKRVCPKSDFFRLWVWAVGCTCCSIACPSDGLFTAVKERTEKERCCLGISTFSVEIKITSLWVNTEPNHNVRLITCAIRVFVSSCTRRTAEANTMTITNFTRGRQTGLDARLKTEFWLCSKRASRYKYGKTLAYEFSQAPLQRFKCTIYNIKTCVDKICDTGS